MDNLIARCRPSGALRTGLLAVALTLGLVQAPPSQAQLVTAEAGPSLLAHLMNQLNTLTQRFQDYYQYGEEAVRWKATWDHYYQQIAKFVGVVRNPALNSKLNFQAVDPLFNVEERCGAGGGLSVSSLAAMVTMRADDGIVENQRAICAKIQMLENQKYNAVVSYFHDVEPVIKQDLERIEQQRRTNNEQGTLQAVAEASERLSNQMEISQAELTRQLEASDQMIAALTAMQQSLAQQALKGKPRPVIGTLVKTATLEAALKAK